MKAYISGKMTGLPDLNKPMFEKAEQVLKISGMESFNPINLNMIKINPTWEDYMRADIIELMHCDCVVALPDWRDSRGAKIEVKLAFDLGMPVYQFDGKKVITRLLRYDVKNTPTKQAAVCHTK